MRLTNNHSGNVSLPSTIALGLADSHNKKNYYYLGVQYEEKQINWIISARV